MHRVPRRSPAPALFSILVALIYGASPIDVLPDVVLLVGWADDALVMLALFALAAWHWFRGRGPKRGQAVPSLRPAR